MFQGAVAGGDLVGSPVGLLDTLEQVDNDTPAAISAGVAPGLQKRARRKLFGRAIASALLNHNPGSPLRKGYKQTLFCGDTVLIRDGKATSRYCGHRWCPSCNAIRSARLSSKYGAQISAWLQPMFLTLTRPNVDAAGLPAEIAALNASFRLLVRSVQRDCKVTAIRKLEITYNDRNDTYHPHFHVLVDGSAVAFELARRWLERNPLACGEAQDVKPADDGTVMELFKYVTKLQTGKRGVFPRALDVIFQALRGRRTVAAYGVQAVSEDVSGERSDDVSAVISAGVEGTSWRWNDEFHDWLEARGGQDERFDDDMLWDRLESARRLTGYEPVERFSEFCAGIRSMRA